MMAELQQAIWQHFALKRRQFYFAAFILGLIAGLFGSLRGADDGFGLWAIPVCGVVGVGAVGLLSCGERLQARLDQARLNGKPGRARQVLFIAFGLIALVVVALLIAGLCLFLL